MDQKIAEAIVEACETEGVEASLRDDYSGRGMYGKTTHAVAVNGSLASVLMAVINQADQFVYQEEDFAEAKFFMRGLNQDSLGLGVIIY